MPIDPKVLDAIADTPQLPGSNYGHQEIRLALELGFARAEIAGLREQLRGPAHSAGAEGMGIVKKLSERLRIDGLPLLADEVEVLESYRDQLLAGTKEWGVRWPSGNTHKAPSESYTDWYVRHFPETSKQWRTPAGQWQDAEPGK